MGMNTRARKTRTQYLKIIRKIIINPQADVHAFGPHSLNGRHLATKLVHVRAMGKVRAGLGEGIDLVLINLKAMYRDHIGTQHTVSERVIELRHAMDVLHEIPFTEAKMNREAKAHVVCTHSQPLQQLR